MLSLVAALGLLSAVKAFDATSNSNVAVYWGQNAGLSQTRLSDYCTSDSVDIVLLAFLSGFPDTTINFSNQCWTETCPDIGTDIQTCQDNGKVVLLSMGGAAGSYGFSSDSEAQDYALTLWNTFGAGSDDSVTRPFGDAIVDGFDFDVENGDQTGYVALAESLRSYFAEDTSKSYYLSAAPQCPYPDTNVGDLLADADLDFAFIQFYNNYCDLNTDDFNYATWEDFAQEKDIKLFVGLPGSSTAASSGYTDASEVAEKIADFQCDSSFGGVSLWDASAAFGNDNYQDQIKAILGQSCATASASASSVAASASSVASTASSVASSVSAAVSAAPYSNATVTNIATTVVTITSCSDHKCSAVAVTTGLTTVTDVDTIYTTYCPLSGATETATEASESSVAASTSSVAGVGYTIVSSEDTVQTVTAVGTQYTTLCPESLTGDVTSTVNVYQTVTASTNGTYIVPAASTYEAGAASYGVGYLSLVVAGVFAAFV